VSRGDHSGIRAPGLPDVLSRTEVRSGGRYQSGGENDCGKFLKAHAIACFESREDFGF